MTPLPSEGRSRAARSRLPCSRSTWRRKRAPSRTDALLSPERRSPKTSGTSRFFSPGVRARISTRILNPSGWSRSRSTADRLTRKNPVIGSVTPASRRGNRTRTRSVDRLETPTRTPLDRPVEEPPATCRLATTTSARSSSATRTRSGTSSGGCWRSPSITTASGRSDRASPESTAPPSPPARSPAARWCSRTGSGLPAAASSICSGVSSSLSSTKRISASQPCSVPPSRSSSGPTFRASLRVGTITVRAPGPRVPVAGCLMRPPLGQRHTLRRNGRRRRSRGMDPTVVIVRCHQLAPWLLGSVVERTKQELPQADARHHGREPWDSPPRRGPALLQNPYLLPWVV